MSWRAPASPWLVPAAGSWTSRTTPRRGTPGKHVLKRRLARDVERLDALQNLLYAGERRSLLLVFQALDAGGKDSTIRAVLSGVNPMGCAVHSFKQPSREELRHDFLWRYLQRLPPLGMIGVFNRSHYESVLVERVHPDLLAPGLQGGPALWRERFAAIRAFERHLAVSGTVVLKFWLNVSKAEQRRRFLARLGQPAKMWKFQEGDLVERGYWPAYQRAYREALRQTSRPWAPWYAIPADDKPYMRAAVADIVVRALQNMRLRYPVLDAKQRRRFAKLEAQLERG
ncbi:MAG TPA: PPK2 family polyphosphate kinase [Candidatus Binatia bacterium]|nr:PPK2 family polyphosphate kinase [Candidatus Binatia bacterium]